MTRKKTNANLGRMFQNEKKRLATQYRSKTEAEAAQDRTNSAAHAQNSRSVLEQSNMDDLIATVAMRTERYAEAYGEAEYVEVGPTLLHVEELTAVEDAAARKRDLMSIPRRPPWSSGMNAEEIRALENEAFIEWRRQLAGIQKEESLHLTPYERNLDFWRQLWRCIERSDLIVQILDARDPDFYYCRDIDRYVGELDPSKRVMLLLNKADFLTPEQRRAWREHFSQRGIDIVFFSALREVRSQSQAHGGVRPASRIRGSSPGSAEPAGRSASEAEPIRVQSSSDSEHAEGSSAFPGAHVEPDMLVNPVDIPVPSDTDEDSSDGGLQRRAEGNRAKGDVNDGSEKDYDDDAGSDPAVSLSPLRFLPDEPCDVADSAGLLDELLSRLPAKLQCEDDGASTSCTLVDKGTIGFVGYPNVGKSTVINALVGQKRVGMSSTPGKTKHIQTLKLPSLGVTFCDCPGLVFPSVVATKAHLVINNTVPLDDLRECFSPVQLIIEKVGLSKLFEKYGCQAQVRDAAKRVGDQALDEVRIFLCALAASRNHVLWVGVPDEQWAARKLLRDYVSGALLHCESPRQEKAANLTAPGDEEIKHEQYDQQGAAIAAACDTDKPTQEVVADVLEAAAEDDFGDLDEFLSGRASGAQGRVRNMTKRKARQLNKQLTKGAGPAAADSGTMHVSGGRVVH